MSPTWPIASPQSRTAFLVLPGDVAAPEGIRALGRLDRFDLAVPVAGRLGAEVLIVSQRLVDAERGWDAVRSLRQQHGVDIWVYADGPPGGRAAWADLAAKVLEVDNPPAQHPTGLSTSVAADRPGRARVVVVIGAKGGSGKTFVAANLATALAVGGCKVALIDLDFESGDLALRLGLEPRVDLLSAAQADPSAWMASRSEPPMALWAAPARPELACLADEALVRKVLDAAAITHDVVLVDTPGDPDQDNIYTALDGADLALLVSTLNPGTVRQCRVMFDLIKRLNFPVRERLCLVLNRVRRRSVMTPVAAADLIGQDPAAMLPDVPHLADAEAYYGQPTILRCRRRGPLAKGILALALRADPRATYSTGASRPGPWPFGRSTRVHAAPVGRWGQR